MQDQQVDLVDAELAGALLEPVQGLLVAVVADPDLGLEEDVGAIQAGAGDRLADLSFVAVCGGGVDVPVPADSAAATAERVSSGGVWKTPKPMAGKVTPLFKVSVGTSGMVVSFLSAVAEVVSRGWGRASEPRSWTVGLTA